MYGAIGGALGAGGTWLGSAIGTAIGGGVGTVGGSWGGIIGSGFGAAAGGALSATITGGDPGMSAIIAGATAGIASGLSPGLAGAINGYSAETQYLIQLSVSTGVGAGVGGTVAEIKGGNFWQAAADSAIYASAGFVVSSVIASQFENSGNSQGAISDDEPIMLACDGLDPNAPSIDSKIETIKVGGVDVTVVDGVGQLDDATYNAIIKNDIAKVNKWSRNPFKHWSKLATLDSPFHGSRVKKWLYEGKVYHTSEVNYILQGHAHRHLLFPRWLSRMAVNWHNERTYGHPASPGEHFWTDKGYKEYGQRKEW